jgi:hypothetical protein
VAATEKRPKSGEEGKGRWGRSNHQSTIVTERRRKVAYDWLDRVPGGSSSRIVPNRDPTRTEDPRWVSCSGSGRRPPVRPSFLPILPKDSFAVKFGPID